MLTEPPLSYTLPEFYSSVEITDEFTYVEVRFWADDKGTLRTVSCSLYLFYTGLGIKVLEL